MGVSQSQPRDVKSVHFPAFEKNLPSLAGKTIVVTGCTTGTGYVLARTAIRKGAENVLLLNRPSARADAAEESLKKEVTTVEGTAATNVETIPCDLQSFENVRKAAGAIKAKYEGVDVLCNNAGVMALEDCTTEDGYDVQMQTNHLSHFLLMHELLPLLKAAKERRGEARVVSHSSAARHGGKLEAKYFGKNGGNLGGNKAGWVPFSGPKWERYHQTKLANSVFTLALKERLDKSQDYEGIIAAAAAPGLAATNLQITTAETGGMQGSMWIMRFAQSAEDGTMPLAAACFDPATENGSFWEPNGKTRLAGEARMFELEPKIHDEESMAMLWEQSEEACGTMF